MAKFIIRPGYDSSKTKLSVSTLADSTMELDVGEAYDLSTREIEIVERESKAIEAEIGKLRGLISDLSASVQAGKLASEVSTVTNTAEKILAERKWYSISLKGLAEAAKAFGEVASPTIASAVKLIELLSKAKH